MNTQLHMPIRRKYFLRTHAQLLSPWRRLLDVLEMSLNALLGGLDKANGTSASVKWPDVEPEKIKPFIAMHDSSFRLAQSQAS